MPHYLAPIEQLIQSFVALPGVGRKTAERYVFYLLKQSPQLLEDFSARLTTAATTLQLCQRCYNFSLTTLCTICKDTSRDHSLVCVVAESPNVFALEQTEAWPGVYHVLGGTINQLDGVGPKQLRIQELVNRVKQGAITEIMIATNPDTMGETTALYIVEALKPYTIKTTRLARGLPAGADIEYADDVTLGNALRERKPIQ